MTKPDIFVFTGTAGSGRKTMAHRLGIEINLMHVVSCTTRLPRGKERLDLDYHYISRDEFEEMQRNGQFVQSVEIDNEKYGIRTRDLENALLSGKAVYLILNREGASVIKQLYGDRVIRLFLYVDKPTVRERLESKGTEPELIDHILSHYTEEVGYRKLCEHIFQNLDITETRNQIKEVIRTYRPEIC